MSLLSLLPEYGRGAVYRSVGDARTKPHPVIDNNLLETALWNPPFKLTSHFLYSLASPRMAYNWGLGEPEGIMAGFLHKGPVIPLSIPPSPVGSANSSITITVDLATSIICCLVNYHVVYEREESYATIVHFKYLLPLSRLFIQGFFPPEFK